MKDSVTPSILNEFSKGLGYTKIFELRLYSFIFTSDEQFDGIESVVKVWTIGTKTLLKATCSTCSKYTTSVSVNSVSACCVYCYFATSTFSY